MIYGLLGKNLGHSYSPEIHRAFGRYDYRLIELPEEALEGFLRNPEIGGLNVTIPYKESVAPFCRRLTPLAKEIGAVNTIYREGGELVGDNTDYYGFLQLLRRSGISLIGKKVLVLGNGGASRMVCYACRKLKARETVVVTRDGRPGTISYEELPRHGDGEILIHATPAGMYPDNESTAADLERLPGCRIVVDLIYNPLTTRLMAQARERGLLAVGGLPMLVYQAADACKAFTGSPVPASRVEKILADLAFRMQNLVLIGMPGSGKTTLGRLLAEELGRPFADMDLLIEEEQGISVPQIFERHGEDAFRRMEKDLAKRVGKGRGQVIATGGGTVLDPENVRSLAQNGTLIFLDRPLDQLAREGRPLSASPAALEHMSRKRRPLYEAAADYIIAVENTPEDSLKRLRIVAGGKKP